MATKAIEDATAYIRSLAQLRGRNVDFAVRAVSEAACLSSEEALNQGVIDLVAVDLSSLLVKLDGREVPMLGGKTVLATAKAPVARFDPDWRNRILALLTNPQVALILMLIGVYGLFFEFTSPGFGVPGVAGTIALLIALYAFHLLPVNWTGVLLLVIGAAMMLSEAFVPSFGALGVGGIVAFIFGGIFLMDTEIPGFGVPLALIVGLAFASAALLLTIGRFWKVKGPGLVIVIPGIQQIVKVDLRVVTMDVPPQDVISRDNVSVQVNAIVFFRAEGEKQAAQALMEAAEMLSREPAAMQLRYLQTLTQVAGDKSSTLVFPVPVDFIGSLAWA